MPKLSVTLVDAFGRYTRKLFELQEQAVFADLETVANTFLGTLEDVTDLGLVRADIIMDGYGTPWAPTAGSNIDVGATIVGYVYGGNGKKAVTKIPGIDLDFVREDGSIDIALTDMATYLAWWEDPNYDLMLSDGEHIDAWIAGTLDK